MTGSSRVVGELFPESRLGEDAIEPELLGDKASGLARFAAASETSVWRLAEVVLVIDVRVGST